MSDSSLVDVVMLSPNRNSPRNHKIDTITIHCMAGNLTVETCGRLFQKESRHASSNYGIGTDGRIGLYVHEADRAWTSGSPSNDHRAITIEVANDGGADTGWHVSDQAMAALLDLLTDICKRNSIKKLLWKADKSLIGKVEQQNMTVHRWFQNKACPGDYLYNKHGWIAEQVNKRLEPLPDGKKYIPVLCNGTVVQCIGTLENGITYIQLRNLAEPMGIADVSWDPQRRLPIVTSK